MSVKLNRLTARRVNILEKPGRYADGGSLYLKVRPGGSKQWVVMFAIMVDTGNGKKKRKQTELSLGPAGEGGLSLAEARNRAAQIRVQRLAGLDPKLERKRAHSILTFGQIADEYIETHAPSFKSAKHVKQWQATLGDAYCKAIRTRPVNAIDTDAVLEILRPIWTTIPETASRIRGRIERVLASAIVANQHPGPNPAIWKGHLDTKLPKRSKLTRGHHAALPYDEMPNFLSLLRANDSLAAKALELTILTACRTSEILQARWSEIEIEKRIWIIPRERMKSGVAHRVPLCHRAIATLKSLPAVSEYVFPNIKTGQPLSGMAMAMQLRRMGRQDITVHGFRSSFRDWASEQTSFSHETCEHALAHRISDKAEAAYRRGDQFEKRRKLMEAWMVHCEQKT